MRTRMRGIYTKGQHATYTNKCNLQRGTFTMVLTLEVHLGHEGLGAPNGGDEDGGLHFLGKRRGLSEQTGNCVTRSDVD